MNFVYVENIDSNDDLNIDLQGVLEYFMSAVHHFHKIIYLRCLKDF